jgi:hypothetical protein
MKGPPIARSKKPVKYPSNGKLEPNEKTRLPRASRTLPMMLVKRGPYASRIAPIGRAKTLVATAANENKRFKLAKFVYQHTRKNNKHAIRTYRISCM